MANVRTMLNNLITTLETESSEDWFGQKPLEPKFCAKCQVLDVLIFIFKRFSKKLCL